MNEPATPAADPHVIVGGSGGIGGELTRRLLNRGNRVVVISRTTGDLNLEATGLTHVVADVCDAFPVDALPDRIAGLAYCPGSINLGPLRGVKPEALRDEFNLNVVGAVRAIQAAQRGLKAAGGSVVLFSTVAVGQGMPMHASVASVKGALEGLTRSLAAELAPAIRVNAIAPSLTDTPLAARLLSSEERRDAMAKRHPLGRVGTAADVAAVAEFLLAGESTWITGQVIGVDGGLSTLRV